MKKILLIIPNAGLGGAQRVFHDLSLILSPYFEVTECVFNLDDGHVFQTGNTFLSLDVPGGKTVFDKLWNFFRRINRLRKIKEENNFDYAISHLEGADYVNILSRKKEKVILCVHGTKKYDLEIRGILGWIRKNIFIKIIYRWADRIVCVSHGIKQELRKEFNLSESKLFVIQNGFDLRSILEKTEEPLDSIFEPVFSGRKVLIAHGRFAPQKNFSELLFVLSRQEIRARFKLVLIGDGPKREELIHVAKARGLSLSDVAQNFSPDDDLVLLGYP